MAKKTKTGTLEFEVIATATAGIVVPVQMVVTFPEGYGFYAVKVLEKIHEETPMFYSDLIRRGDMSTLMVLASKADEEEE